MSEHGVGKVYYRIKRNARSEPGIYSHYILLQQCMYTAVGKQNIKT